MPELSIVLVGTYPPRHDGLASFAADLAEAVCAQRTIRLRVIAIDSQGETCHYHPAVVGRIEQPYSDSYLRAADQVRQQIEKSYEQNRARPWPQPDVIDPSGVRGEGCARAEPARRRMSRRSPRSS